MLIPKSFSLAGQVFKVERKKKIVHEVEGEEDCECHGLCFPDENKIIVSTDIIPTRQEYVYLHELTHAILHSMGRQEDYNNEEFVSTFANLLHQALTTSK